MITLKNTTVTDNWIIDLKTYSQVEGRLPLNGLNVRNDSNITAWVDLDGLKVGEVQRYSADPFQGRDFDKIRIYNPEGQEFAANDLFIQATKGEVMSSQPFNPQWDMMFFDLTRYSTGTDSRISLSPSVNAEIIKYFINAQNSLIVQRRLDIQAHATLLGEYSVIFSALDVLSGAVGIGTPPPPDIQQYKKSIVNSEFDYSLTNTSIAGWVVDYRLNPDDMASNGTISIDLPGNGEKAVDDDMSTNQDPHTSTNTAWYSILEIEFSPSVTVIGGHIAAMLAKSTDGASEVKIQGYNGSSWEDITGVISASGGDYTLKTLNTPNISIPNIEKIRAYRRGTTNPISYCKLVDMTVIHE